MHVQPNNVSRMSQMSLVRSRWCKIKNKEVTITNCLLIDVERSESSHDFAQKEFSFVTNSNCLIPISLDPDCVNL